MVSSSQRPNYWDTDTVPLLCLNIIHLLFKELNIYCAREQQRSTDFIA